MEIEVFIFLRQTLIDVHKVCLCQYYTLISELRDKDEWVSKTR